MSEWWHALWRMLIHEYAVAIMQCGGCEAPLPAKTEPGAPCPYCGASQSGAREVGAFSHDIRVLVCDSCAAPMTAPIGGGTVTCSYCQTSFEITPRRERILGRGGDGDEAARLRRLRAQDKGPIFPPALVRPLMKKGGVHDDSADRATAMWREARIDIGKLRQAPEGQAAELAELEERLYFLTELLADYHNWKKRPLVARSFLEASLDSLSDPRFVQPIYCWLARNAGLSGDDRAAEAWLDLCDKRPEDLGMDSAVRFTWAVISMHRGDFEGVLLALGEGPEHVPLNDKYDKVAVIYRAHALEMLRGAPAGAEHLLNSIRPYQHSWQFMFTIVEANEPRLVLCPQSLGIAVRQRWGWAKPIFATVVFLAGLAALAADTFGDRALKQGIYPLSIFWTLLVGGASYVTFSTRVALRRSLGAVESSPLRRGNGDGGDGDGDGRKESKRP